MNNNGDKSVAIDFENNYRFFIFSYIGCTIQGDSTINNKAKHVYHITGGKGKYAHALFLMLCFFSFYGSFSGSPLNIFNSQNLLFDIIGNINKSSVLYKVLEPMGLIDIKFIVFIFTILLVIIKRKQTYKKLEPIASSINIYSRDLPSSLRPAHMRILLNDGLIDKVSMGSTIIDLVDRGYLEYSRARDENDKLLFFHRGDSKLIKTNKSHDDLLKYEKFLINWFIDGYGDGVEVTADGVNYGLKNKQIYHNMEPADMFYEWQALVLMSFPIDNYYTKIKPSTIKYIYLIVGLIGLISLMTFIGSILFIYCFGMLILASPSRALNQTGVDEIGSWISLKNFLLDFGDMKNKTAEMVKIWDFYLTYAVALNVSDKAAKEINNFFGDNIYLGSFDNNRAGHFYSKVTNFSSYMGKTAFFEKKAHKPETLNESGVQISEYSLGDKIKYEIEAEYKKL